MKMERKALGVYIVLDKQEQLNQPTFFKTLQEITEMSEKTNRFLDQSTLTKNSVLFVKKQTPYISIKIYE